MGFSKVLALLFSILSFSVCVKAATWVETESHRFSLFESLKRCQGVVTDRNGNFWFSANSNLFRTNSWNGSSKEENGSPFSDDLTNANHIGDIDYAHGLIYAPIEDGSKYKYPFVGVYNANDLQLRQFFSLPHDWQPDGVPWVTVDPTGQRLISSQYSNTTKINIYDLGTGRPVKQIAMSQMITSIQGGKYWNNHLYMTANDPQGGFALYDMNLQTGVIQKMIHLNKDIVEIEGLTFLTAKNAAKPEQAEITDFYILGLTGSGLGKRIVFYRWVKK